jgi:site-specific DNA-methyltransferase (adenine-specific)
VISVLHGDCRAVLAGMEPDSFDAVVTDPPYHLTAEKRGGTGPASLNLASPAGRSRITTGFMGRAWDGGDVAFRPETWAAVLRVLRPGAHLAAFGGERTFHRLACAIEDAGFEIRHTIAWLYASGFCKVGYIRGTDGEHVMNGWAGSLKPAMELICLARKPMSERNTAENMRRWGTGALNIDAGRVEYTPGGRPSDSCWSKNAKSGNKDGSRIYNGGYKTTNLTIAEKEHPAGRWPANLAHDGSDEVLAAFARFGERRTAGNVNPTNQPIGYMSGSERKALPINHQDTGTAARFFFTAKAASWEREGDHPTIKPLALLEWLVTLVTPPGGRVLDPFCGTGTTLAACDWLGLEAVGIEQDAKTCRDAEAKIQRLRARRMLGKVTPTEISPDQMRLF